jgi:hypothetical protein
MTRLVHQSTPKARKNYWCDACGMIETYGSLRQIITEHDFTLSERRALVRAWDNNRQIQKGDVYIRQFCVDGGDAYTFKSIPEIHAICIKYDIYYE